MSRLAGLWWALGSIAVIAIILASPQIIQLAALGLMILAALTFVLPFKAVVILWGATLPIWSIGSLDPMVFDGVRIVLALMILIKAGRLSGPSLFTRRVLVLVSLLSVVAITITLLGALRPDHQSLTSGLTMCLGLAVASIVICRLEEPWDLFNGYLLGAVLSGAVLVASAFGFTALTPQTNGGFFRLTGLAPSATLVTYQMAIGVAIAWGAFGRKVHRLWYVLAMLLCLAALALSGGRGGVVALAACVLIAVRWRWLRLVPVLALAAVGWVGLTLAESAGLTVNTLARLLDSAQTGESDGRIALFVAGLQDVLANPFTGPGLDAYRQQTGLVPHVAILTFFVAGGVLCGAVIIYATLALIGRVLFVNPRPYGAAGRASYLVLVVVITMGFLEPGGPFIGTAFLALMFACVGATSLKRNDPAADGDKRESGSVTETRDASGVAAKESREPAAAVRSLP